MIWDRLSASASKTARPGRFGSIRKPDPRPQSSSFPEYLCGRVCYTGKLGLPARVTTSTSLNLRAVLKTAVARSGMDRLAREVSGLTPSAKALYVAAQAQALAHGAVLF